jgi:AcrR family transcriptional regulator
MAPPRPRRVRADAQRNRAALVAAAYEVLSERGLDAPLEAVARRAGVGSATLYRHFPTRTALLEAVVADRFAEYAEAVEAALGADDPWEGLQALLLPVLRLQAADHALADLRAAVPGTTTDLQDLHRRALDGTADLVGRAKAAGSLRADFEVHDVGLLLMACAGIVERTAAHAPGSWERVAAFLLDGLRAEAATSTPPPVSASALVEAVADRAGGSVAALR